MNALDTLYRKANLIVMQSNFENALRREEKEEMSKYQNRVLEAMKHYVEGLKDDPDPVQFFNAWAVSPAIIAERLRRSGFQADAEHINEIMKNGIHDKMDRYLLSVAMMEMKNDINRTLHP